MNWTLISLVLGAFFLVVMIWGFTTNWTFFSSFFSSGNNVNAIVTQCQTSCASSDTYGFCTMNRTLKASDIPETGLKEKTETCSYFATTSNPDYKGKYRIADCPSLSC